jgi:glycosyltransferase involved in cell wall biosynthesis
MKILFIGFWGLSDPLTLATTFPNLQLLSELSHVKLIRLATVERDKVPTAIYPLPFATDKVTHQSLVSRQRGSLIGTKIEEFIRFPRELSNTVSELGIDIIIGRGAMAGALAYLTSKRTGKPFYVESFEPHAEYMLDSGVWGRYDPRYIFQHFWEKKEKKYASGLMPVAENYRRQLIAEDIPAEKIITVPCSVNLTTFSFDASARSQIRHALTWSDEAIVGAYVGKFGGIYYDEEAFTIFRQAADFFGANFRLLLLTPQPVADVQAKLRAVCFNPEHAVIKLVPFSEVPAYLSAADFAFGLHLPTPYVSPVKVGEYWATGLPVLMADGVGDDSAIIKAEAGGSIFNLEYPGSVQTALADISQQISHQGYRESIRQLAVRHRSLDLSRQAYQYFFGT